MNRTKMRKKLREINAYFVHKTPYEQLEEELAETQNELRELKQKFWELIENEHNRNDDLTRD